MTGPRRSALALALAALGSACAGTAAERAGPMPFTLAVAVDAMAGRRAAGGGADDDRHLREGGVEESAAMRIFPSERALARAVAEGLAERLADRFLRVELLEPPRADDAELRRWSEGEWSAHWARAAAAVEADVLLSCEIDYSSAVGSRTNGAFVPTTLLHVLLPFVGWFPNDRTYYTRVACRARLYDVGSIGGGAGPARLAERGLLAESRAEVREQDLDFLDRASGDVRAMATTLIKPPGWVATESEEARLTLEHNAVELLTDALAREIRAEDDAIAKAPGVFNYWLDNDSVRVGRGPGGTCQLAASLYLDRTRGVQSMRELRVYPLRSSGAAGVQEAGAALATVALDADADAQLVEYAGRPHERYRISLSVPVDASVRFLKLELVDGASKRRTYTFGPLRSGTGGAL